MSTERAAPTGAWDALWRRVQRIPRPVRYGTVIILLVAVLVGMSLLSLLVELDQDDLNSLGYAGLFVANFLGTATVFVPVPGLTAAGQALIVTMAESRNPWLVAAAGGAGMTLAETTAYATGRLGRAVGEERHWLLRGRLGDVLRRAADLVNRLMLRWGFLTLLVLAAIPNPVFEFAGVTAGAVRMNFWRFLLAVAIGKGIRALALAFVGGWLLGPAEV